MILVAGIGNLLARDDGFGVEVAKRLVGRDLPAEVIVQDVGLRGVHLAFDLLGAPDTTVFVDACRRGQPPGTLYLLELDPDVTASAVLDGHSIDVNGVLAMVRRFGGRLREVLLVGCEPASLEEGIGLSEQVEAALPGAVSMILELVTDRCGAGSLEGG